ncbi:MAG TPA: DUF86 domain-containing protein [Flavobacteriaceae bacterium]|nr:DUF86 domain-containing protein [Flavobacteriaceae bacterium]
MMYKNLFRLEHIQECISKIEELVRILKTYENFEEKWIEQDSVIRNFEIIGEASNHISDDLKAKHPDIAWSEMKGMRNFMTHEYFGLQLDTIWDAAVNDIPILKKQIQSILQELRSK